MRYPSLNHLYFQSLHIPSAPIIWIGCSVALHVGLFLLPLGGSNRQNIAFAPGDAGVQVELVADESPQSEPATTTPDILPEPPLLAEVSPPDENFVFPEPAPQPIRQTVARKERAPLRSENLKATDEGAAVGGARAGSASAQPAAQIFTTQPPYPSSARDLGVEGDVRLRVRVGVDGSPRAVEIARSSGRADFDSTSLSTVKREWRFRPARTVSGAPVESTVTVAIHFNLRS